MPALKIPAARPCVKFDFLSFFPSNRPLIGGLYYVYIKLLYIVTSH